MGERDHFVSLEMAAVGIEMMAAWGAAAVAQRLEMLTAMLAVGLQGMDARTSKPHLRSPHILGVGFERGIPPELVQALAAEKVFVAPRVGRLRISPHVYNDEQDVERFVKVFRKAAFQ